MDMCRNEQQQTILILTVGSLLSQTDIAYVDLLFSCPRLVRHRSYMYTGVIRRQTSPRAIHCLYD